MRTSKNPLTKYVKIFLTGWILIILVIGGVGFGLVWNDYQKSKAETQYWNKLRDEVGKETVIRQIHEYPERVK